MIKLKLQLFLPTIFVHYIKTYKSVQIPLSTLGIFGMAPEDCYDFYLQTGDKLYLQSLTTMIIITEKKTSKTHGFFMTVVPDKSYRDKYKYKSFHSGYLNWPKDFSGYIKYHNLDGSFNIGWRFEDGIITQKTTRNKKNNLGLRLKSNPCIDYFWVEYYIYCTDWWVMTETGTSYMGYTCDWNILEEWTYMYSECLEPYQHDDDPYYEEYYGGGGYEPEEPEPQVTPLVNGLNELFRANELNNEDTKKLNEAYEKMRTDCIYKYIDNFLLNNNVELNTISYDEDMIGVGSISSQNNLFFPSGDYINAETLKHEWFHLFQRYWGGINIFDNNYTGMSEFENALLNDILFFVKIDGQHRLYANSWACVGTGDLYRVEYMDWLNNITQNGTNYQDDINASEFQYFSTIFGEVDRAYNVTRGYIYGAENYEAEVISNVLNYAKYNCNY